MPQEIRRRLGPLATECADRLCSCSEIRDPPLHLQLWKKPQRAKHLTHVLSLVALIFFTPSPSKSRLKSTTKKAHYCCYLWLMHSPCFQLLLPLFYSVENSCTAIASTASSTIHLQLPFSWKRSNLPPQCFFLHQISKFWTKGASALFHRNTSYG